MHIGRKDLDSIGPRIKLLYETFVLFTYGMSTAMSMVMYVDMSSLGLFISLTMLAFATVNIICNVVLVYNTFYEVSVHIVSVKFLDFFFQIPSSNQNI